MPTRLAVCLALAALLAGCSGGDGDPITRSTAVAPVQPAPRPEFRPEVDTDEEGILAVHARLLAVEVGLDAEAEARVAALLERAWADAQADVQGRIDAALPVDEEVVSALLLSRQRQADAEIAALLTPAQRARFEELGGRIGVEDDEERVTTDGGAR